MGNANSMRATAPKTLSGRTRQAAGSAAGPEEPKAGFIRTLLAGQGGTLTQAFANAASSPHTSIVERNAARGLRRIRIDRNLPQASGYYELFEIGSGIRVVVEDLRDVGARLEMAQGEDLVSFHLRLAGEFLASLGSPQPVRFQGPHLGARFQPRGVGVRLYFPPVPAARSVTIFCEPDMVLHNLVAGRESLPENARRLFEASAPEFSYGRLPVSSEIITCAHSWFDSPLVGPLRLPYFEARTIELLMLCLNAFTRLEGSAIERFSEQDIRRFHQAHEILSRRFKPVPTITSLARELAINETKLKSGFKALFGHTVFDFGHDCRMQHALHLLRDERLRISQVATAIGYRHQGTFASAFKAHFGICPKDVKHPPAPMEASVPTTSTNPTAARLRKKISA